MKLYSPLCVIKGGGGAVYSFSVLVFLASFLLFLLPHDVFTFRLQNLSIDDALYVANPEKESRILDESIQNGTLILRFPGYKNLGKEETPLLVKLLR